MILPRCGWCAAPTPEALCRRCVVELLGLLRQATWLAEQIQINVTRRSRSGGRYRDGGRSDDKPVVFDTGASEAAWILHHTIQPWALDLRDRIRASPADPTTAGLATWMAHHIGHVAMLEGVADMLAELRSACDKCLLSIDSRTPRLYLGDCDCGTAIHGSADRDESVCWRCHKTYRTGEWRDANRKAGRELLVTLDEAATYLGEVYGIQATRSRLDRYAKSLQKHPGDTYRVGDLLDVIRNISNKQAARRADLMRKKLGLD